MRIMVYYIRRNTIGADGYVIAYNDKYTIILILCSALFPRVIRAILHNQCINGVT